MSDNKKMSELDYELSDEDFVVKLPVDIDPTKIKMVASMDDGDFSVTITVHGPFNEEEEAILDGLCEAIEESNKEENKTNRSLN